MVLSVAQRSVKLNDLNYFCQHIASDHFRNGYQIIQFNHFAFFHSINSINSLLNFQSQIIQFNSIQFNSIQFNSIQFNSINSIPFSSISFNSNIGAFQRIQGLSLYQNYIGVYYPDLAQAPGNFSEKMEEQFNSYKFPIIQIIFKKLKIHQ